MFANDYYIEELWETAFIEAVNAMHANPFAAADRRVKAYKERASKNK